MILDKIAAAARRRVAAAQAETPTAALRDQAEALAANQDFPFERALATPDIALICEVKKASPSKGVIAADFPYLDIAREYEAAGAAAISVLTEPDFFMGSPRILRDIARQARIPLLRKDFIIDEWQIYEAKLLGAAAILLIGALLDTKTVARYSEIAAALGLSALVEAHTADEVRAALDAGAKIVGVNNRNLQTFEVDIATSLRLRALVPEPVLYVAESGIRTPEDVRRLADSGVDGVLIGETLMKCPDKRQFIRAARGLATETSCTEASGGEKP